MKIKKYLSSVLGWLAGKKNDRPEKDSELDAEFKSRRAEEAAKLNPDTNEWVRYNRNFD